jgi:hypothetical protein
MEIDKDIPPIYKPTGFHTKCVLESRDIVICNNNLLDFCRTRNIKIKVNGKRISLIDIVTKILVDRDADDIILFSQCANDNYEIALLSCRYCNSYVVSVLIASRIHCWKECNSFGGIEEYFYLAAERRDDNVEVMDVLVSALKQCSYYSNSRCGMISILNSLYQCENMNMFKYLYKILRQDFADLTIYDSSCFNKQVLWFGKNIEIIEFLIDNDCVTTENIIDGVLLNRDPKIISLVKDYILCGKLCSNHLESILDEKN